MSQGRLTKAKRSFITRNVLFAGDEQLTQGVPAEGDLLLARVDRVRQHTRLENIHGRREHLYPGDEIILVAGRRYSTAQFKAELPQALGPAHLVAAGGIAAQVTARCNRIKPATEITLLGLIANKQGAPLNLADFATLSGGRKTVASMPQLVVVGSDMDAGKTTSAAAVINGLSGLGYKVFAAKLTGTGAGPDFWRMQDAGSYSVMDFVDAGWPSTVGRTTAELLALHSRLTDAAVRSGADLMVVELADGIFQPETAKLIQNPEFKARVTTCLVAADSATAAAMVSQQLLRSGVPVCGISGVITSSPVACDEVRQQSGLPVYTEEQLISAPMAEYLHATLIRPVKHAAVSAG